MSVNTLLVRSYVLTVYMTGRNSLANIAILRPEYVEPVKQHAADTLYIEDIDAALTNGWVTQEEHADTLALKGPEDPQHRPPITLITTPTSTENQ